MSTTCDLLSYMRSESQIDLDSQDLQVAAKYGPFVDFTSNQADCYSELLNPHRLPLIEQSIRYARQIHSKHPHVTQEELAVEVAMVNVAFSLAPYVTGILHIMANPTYADSTPKIIDNAERMIGICRSIAPAFDTSRICIKVPATWEGLQACRKLKGLGIKTLATTVFSMEQIALAAEVGCIYVSPFLHELKAFLDDTYVEPGPPLLDLCVKAQRYFETHGFQTRVKAAGMKNLDDTRRLAGVATVTLPGPLIEELASLQGNREDLLQLSLFRVNVKAEDAPMSKTNFVTNEGVWRNALATSAELRALEKTVQAVEIFSEYQHNAETLMRDVASRMPEDSFHV